MFTRTLEKRDAEQVAFLIPQLTKNIIDDPRGLVGRIRDLTDQPHSQFFVAEKDGLVVGFGGIAWYSIPSKGLIAWVEEIVVDVCSRGNGIARAIMQTIEEEAIKRNVNQIKLTTGTPEARKMYESLGFIQKDQDYYVKTCPKQP